MGTLKETEKHARRLHPTVAFTPERVCLGVLKADYWSRSEPSPRQDRRHKGVDEKESRHWLDSDQDSCVVQGLLPGTLLVNIADREGDIYEWFADYDEHAPVTRAEWIVRATQDRCLLTGGASTAAHRKLWDAVEQAPLLGYLEVDVKPRPNRSGW